MKRTHLVTAIVIAALCALMAVPVANAATARPAQVKGVAVKATSATSLKVTWKTVAKAKGYKVRYCKKATMAGARTVTVKGAKVKSRVLKGLSKCTRYYVQVRAYRTAKVLGKWSVKRTVKTAHAYKQVAGKAATCTAAGYSAYKKCAVCGATLNKKTLKALGHSGKGICCTTCGAAKEITYTWAELKTASNEIGACATEAEALVKAQDYGLLASDGKLTGNEVKSFTLTDGTQCQAQILGFWHDAKSDGNGMAGITFGFKNIPTIHTMNSTCTNTGGWEESEMRTWLNGDFYALLPEDLKSQIVAVDKSTNNAGEAEDASEVTVTSDRLWLPSMVECYGNLSSQSSNVPSRTAVYDAEGSQYKLYSDNEVTTSSYDFLVKRNISGDAYWWWLRSPGASFSYNFYNVTRGGEWYSDNANNSSYGVAPAFCL